MSTVAPPSKPINPVLVDSEQYIDEHIRRTRRSLKLVDLAAGLITLLIGLLGFLLTAAVIDHWTVPGGLSTAGRIALFVAFLAVATWYGWRQFIPLMRPINPVYAAHTIERGAPSLKNSLLNLLLFRSHRRGMSTRVYHALEQQTALRLSTTPVDGSIDHAGLLRLGYALLLIVAACAAYAVFSPKNMAASAVRVLAPWADVAAPSRVQILDVKPGELSVARGERVPISAEIHGLRDDERVRVRFTSLDERVDDSIAMTAAEVGGRFEATLPRNGDGPSVESGVMQDLYYWIEAGDARSQPFKVSVFNRPTIIVQKVHYEYPAYTGFPTKDVDSTGDISGLEGTKVTISALASQPIRMAHVDFDADGSNDLRMISDGDRATATFELALRDDGRTAKHESYLLRFTSNENRTNSDPPTYRIEVKPDYAPEVSITKPEELERAAKFDETVIIGVEARDSDFGLAKVRLMGRVGKGEPVQLAELLSKPHEGRYAHDKPFTPADARLKPGDVLEYWAEADDIRRPEPNTTASERRRLKILGADDKAKNGQQQPPPGGQQQQGQQGGQQQDGGQQQGQPGAQGQGGGQPGNEGQQDQGGEGQGQPSGGNAGGQNEQNGQPQNGESAGGNPADDSSQQQQPQQQPSAGGGAGGANGNEQQQQSGAAEAGGNAGGQQPQQGQPQNREMKPGENADGQPQGQSGARGPDGQPQNGQAPQGQAQDGQPQNGQQPAGQQQPGLGEPQQGAEAQQQGQASGEGQSKVSSKGDNDADAFKKISDFLKGKQGERQSGNGQQPDGEQQPGESPAEDAHHKQSAADNQGEGKASQGGDQRAGANEAGEQPSASDSQSAKPSGVAAQGANESQQKPPAQSDQANGSREDASDAEQKTPTGENPSERQGAATPRKTTNGDGNQGEQQAAKKPSPDSGMNRDDGSAGSGHSTDEQQGSPASDQEFKKGRQKNDGDNREAMNDEEPPGGSPDKKESDSRGGKSGEQSGGGQEGAGQKADAPGNGDAGQHEAADEGAGTADEQGQGETGSDAGRDQIADGKTGESSGDQQGAGSQQRDGQDEPAAQPTADEKPPGEQTPGTMQQPGRGGDSGNQQSQVQREPTGESGKQPAGAQGSEQPREGNATQQQQPGEQRQGEKNDGEPAEQQGSPAATGSAQPSGGGQGGSATSVSPEVAAQEAADEANLAYAREQTNLVLERLDQQLAKKQVDQELLDKLGWTEDELRQFIGRWKSLKERATSEKQDPGAQRELDAALRSLGLRPQGPISFRAGAQADKVRDLKEGVRKSAPMEYADRVRQFQKDLAEGKK